MTIEVAIGDSLGVWRRWAEELSLTPPDSLVVRAGRQQPYLFSSQEMPSLGNRGMPLRTVWWAEAANIRFFVNGLATAPAEGNFHGRCRTRRPARVCWANVRRPDITRLPGTHVMNPRPKTSQPGGMGRAVSESWSGEVW